MKIRNLHLNNFRNYDDYYIEFDDEINILIGKNGQGKTNLIEAIHYLSVSKSFKTHQNKQIINFDSDYCKIDANIFSGDRNRDLSIVLSKEDRRIKVEGQVINKISDYIGYLNTVLFVPDDLSLIKGSPSNRRRFIDLELSKISPMYLYSISKYNYLLKERNKYLKKVSVLDEVYLDVIDIQLAKIQIDIIKRRNMFIENMNRKMIAIYKSIIDSNEDISVEYLCFTSNIDENYILDLYKKNRKRDILYKQTHIGIHKDDIKISFNNQLASMYASQGQIRTIVLSLKISLIEIIKDEIGEYPVLLLDDVLSELDDYRKTMLLSILNKNIQTFITTTSIDGIHHDIINKAKKIYINKKEREV